MATKVWDGRMAVFGQRVLIVGLLIAAMAVWLVTRSGGDDELVRTGAGVVGQEGVVESDHDGDGVELPDPDPTTDPAPGDVGHLAAEPVGRDLAVVEVEGAEPGERPVTDPVEVEELPDDTRMRWLGQEIMVRGRVQAPGPVGFWLKPESDEVDGAGVFVTWGDTDRDPGLAAGEMVTVPGVWRLAANADTDLLAAGVSAGSPYVHALGWDR